MTARASRRIRQPDSRCLPNRERRTQQEKRRCPAAATACAASSAQRTAASLPRGQNPKGRSVLDRTAAAASAVAVLDKKRGRRATTTCAASSAQRTAASLPRGQNPKGRSVLHRTACAASFRARPRRGVRALQSGRARSEVNTRFRD